MPTARKNVGENLSYRPFFSSTKSVLLSDNQTFDDPQENENQESARTGFFCSFNQS